MEKRNEVLFLDATKGYEVAPYVISEMVVNGSLKKEQSQIEVLFGYASWMQELQGESSCGDSSCICSSPFKNKVVE